MQFRRALIYSIASAAMMLASPAPTLFLDMPSSAQAANASVSISTFYSDLAPYGSWVSYHDNYVFVPGQVAADWRPYTAGHWVHTKRYGWLWVSDEPFGWATYHYGRWGYADDIGWYWVPGKRWAPAWVSWRRSNDHVVWAPLPPGRGGDVSVEVRVSDIPDNYWVAVPSRNFLDADLTAVVIHDDNERVRVVEDARPIGSVTVRNNVVVNNVIDVDYVQKTTDKKVETVTVKETDDPKQAGKGGGDGQVAVFNSDVQEEKGAKPAEIKDVEAVKKQKAESGGTQQGQQPTTQGQGTTQEQGTTQGQAEQGQKQPTKKKSTTSEQQTQSEQGQAEQGQEQPTKKKSTTSEQSTQPEQGQAEQGQEQPTKKKKKSTTSEQSTQPEQGQAEQGQEQPTKKKKSTTSEQSTQPEQGQTEQGQEETTTKKKYKASGQPTQQEAQPEQGQEQTTRKKKKSNTSEPTQGEQKQQGCDQATGEGC